MKCMFCDNPVFEGQTKCLEHIYRHREYQKKYHIKNIEKEKERYRKRKIYRVKNRLCTVCGNRLLDEDKNLLTCINCRGRIHGIRW